MHAPQSPTIGSTAALINNSGAAKTSFEGTGTRREDTDDVKKKQVTALINNILAAKTSFEATGTCREDTDEAKKKQSRLQDAD